MLRFSLCSVIPESPSGVSRASQAQASGATRLQLHLTLLRTPYTTPHHTTLLLPPPPTRPTPYQPYPSSFTSLPSPSRSCSVLFVALRSTTLLPTCLLSLCCVSYLPSLHSVPFPCRFQVARARDIHALTPVCCEYIYFTITYRDHAELYAHLITSPLFVPYGVHPRLILHSHCAHLHFVLLHCQPTLMILLHLQVLL